MKGLIFGTLCLLAMSGAAFAACPTPNPNNTAPPFVDGCPLPAAPLNNLAGQVATNTSKIAINTADIANLKADLLGSCANIVAFGGSGDGVTDNAPPFLQAVASNVAQPCVVFPVGNFKFNSKVSVTLSTSANSISILGQGPGVTTLTWPGGPGGISITTSKARQGLGLFSGFSVTTGVAGGGVGLEVINGSGQPETGLNTQGIVENTLFRGADGFSGVDFWDAGIRIEGIGNINFISDYFSGSSGFGGVGIDLEAGPPGLATVYNVIGSQFFCIGTGIIYGDKVQGLTVSGGSNFVCGNVGISVPSGETALDQLTVVGNSFNLSQFGIKISSGVNAVAIADNTFIMGNGTTANAVGIDIAVNQLFTIHGNEFQAGGPNSTGVLVVTGNGQVSQNTCFSVTTCIDISGSGNNGVYTGENVFGGGVTTNIALGTNIAWGSLGVWTPSLIGATSAGTVTYTVRTGQYYQTPQGVLHVQFRIAASNWTGQTGQVQISGLPIANGLGSIGTCTISKFDGITMSAGFTALMPTIATGASNIAIQQGYEGAGNPILDSVANVTNPTIIQLYGNCEYNDF